MKVYSYLIHLKSCFSNNGSPQDSVNIKKKGLDKVVACNTRSVDKR